MIVSKATELKTGGYHYTVTSDDYTSPHSCCAQHDLTPHATAEEAERCHYDYQVARAKVEEYTTAEKCRECGEWTPFSYVRSLSHSTPLCKAHLTLDMLRKHDPFQPGCVTYGS